MPKTIIRWHDLRKSAPKIESPMAHVVCEPCSGCRYTDCVVVCPVDCFHAGEQMLYIHPETCIDCAVCIPECPVTAIFADYDVPPKWERFVSLNEEKSVTLPVIAEREDPLPTAPPRP